MATAVILQDSEGSGSTAAITCSTLAQPPAIGELIIMAGSCAAASRTFTISDNSPGGNTWTKAFELSDANVGQSGAMFWCICSSVFTSVTITISAATGGRLAYCASYPVGTFTATPTDIGIEVVQANTANPTGSSGVLAQAAEQVIVMHVLSGSTTETITPGGTGTWTQDANRQHSASATRYHAIFEQTRAATTSVTYTPSALSGATVDSNIGFLTLKLAASSTNWTVNPSDSVTMSDAVQFDRSMVLPGDSVTMSDAVALGQGKGLADSVTMSDAITSFGWGRTISDSVTMSDTLAFNRLLALTDSVTMSDALAFARDIHLTDSVTMSDIITAGLAFALSVNDSVTMSDVIAIGRGLGLSDSVTMSDLLSFDRAINVADSVTMSDALAFARDIHLSDSVTMGDLVDAALTVLTLYGDTMLAFALAAKRMAYAADVVTDAAASSCIIEADAVSVAVEAPAGAPVYRMVME